MIVNAELTERTKTEVNIGNDMELGGRQCEGLYNIQIIYLEPTEQNK